MITRVAVSTLCLVICSCASAPRTETREDEARRFQAIAAAFDATVVDAGDGISEVEAFKIAHRFFFAGDFVPCGIVWLPKDEGEVWRVPLLEGYSGEHSRDVVVRKSDGSFEVQSPRSAKKPNKAPEPTPGSVTPHADACVAPAHVVAQL